MKTAFIIDPKDNVAIATDDIEKSDVVEINGVKIESLSEIPKGHKIATKEISNNDYVIKYGVPIGRAVGDIKVGEYVHVHNLEDITEELCNEYIKKFMKEA